MIFCMRKACCYLRMLCYLGLTIVTFVLNGLHYMLPSHCHSNVSWYVLPSVILNYNHFLSSCETRSNNNFSSIRKLVLLKFVISNQSIRNFKYPIEKPNEHFVTAIRRHNKNNDWRLILKKSAKYCNMKSENCNPSLRIK